MPSYEKLDRDYYEILQVHRRASLPVIKKAYRALLQDLGHHPDRGGDPATAALINEAYRVLSDPRLREAYDTAYDRSREGAADPRLFAGHFLVSCPRCGTRNRVRVQALLGPLRCARCAQPLHAASPAPPPPSRLAECPRCGRPRTWRRPLCWHGDPRARRALVLASALLCMGLGGWGLYAVLAPRLDPEVVGEQARVAGQWGLAVAAYEQALRREPGDAHGYARLAEALEKQGHLVQALEAYALAERLDRSDATLPLQRGRLWQALGVPARAEAAYRRALELDPQLGEAHLGLGRLAFAAGRDSLAIRHFEHAARFTRSADSYEALGRAWERLGDLVAAETSYAQALIVDPADPEALRQLGLLYFRRQEWAKAESLLGRAAEARPEDAQLHFALGELFRATDRPEQAVAAYRRCLALAGPNAILRERGERALRQMGAHE